MTDWKMLTLVGEDQPGIVAEVTNALYGQGWNLGEASMNRLGGNFTMIMMVSGQGRVEPVLGAVAEKLGLHLHVDDIAGALHRHMVPNIQIRVVGADRAGIVAQVTSALNAFGFNILELESDVAGSEDQPVYIMHIQGYTDAPIEQIEAAVANLGDVDVTVSSIELMIG